MLFPPYSGWVRIFVSETESSTDVETSLWTSQPLPFPERKAKAGYRDLSPYRGAATLSPVPLIPSEPPVLAL